MYRGVDRLVYFPDVEFFHVGGHVFLHTLDHRVVSRRLLSGAIAADPAREVK